MKQRAYAKINLCLDVLGKREDGYHELEMIMVPVQLYDFIEINLAPQLSLVSNARNLPADQRNTVIKAIEVLRQDYGFTENFQIVLQKHIPTQAGLAGGSSDAAAAIRIINRMLKLGMSTQQMVAVGQRVGADVPFCIVSRPAYVRGIGEQLEFFNLHCPFHLLLVKPPKGVSTKLAFERLDLQTARHPNCRAMRTALMQDDYSGVVGNLGNTLEQSAFQIVPQIQKIKSEMLAMGFDGALMSGSGSTVFGITRDEGLLTNATAHFRAQSVFARITRIKESTPKKTDTKKPAAR